MLRVCPVIMELGQTLLPVLINVLGTLFQAATPLISVFSSLAATVLPPVANIIGMLAGTVIPPLVDILGTLNTSIIAPLMPVIQHIVQALLPPLAQLLGIVSPILEGMSPVLGVIGDVLGVIADGLGTVIGWLADGAGKVIDFFSGLFGGAKESKKEVYGKGWREEREGGMVYLYSHFQKKTIKIKNIQTIAPVNINTQLIA